MVTLTLPYPPTTGNHQHGRTRRGRVFTLPAVKTYRSAVWALTSRTPRIFGPVRVTLELEPPDARRRDADNAEKLIFDALVRAGVIDDDSCIREHITRWLEPGRGQVVVTVEEFDACGREARLAEGRTPFPRRSE